MEKSKEKEEGGGPKA